MSDRPHLEGEVYRPQSWWIQTWAQRRGRDGAELKGGCPRGARNSQKGLTWLLSGRRSLPPPCLFTSAGIPCPTPFRLRPWAESGPSKEGTSHPLGPNHPQGSYRPPRTSSLPFPNDIKPTNDIQTECFQEGVTWGVQESRGWPRTSQNHFHVNVL